jgi:hypothetical protein
MTDYFYRHDYQVESYDIFLTLLFCGDFWTTSHTRFDDHALSSLFFNRSLKILL